MSSLNCEQIANLIHKEAEKLRPGTPGTPLMAYELKILYRVLQNLGVTDGREVAEVQVKAEALQDNLRVLRQRLEESQRRNGLLEGKLKEADEQIAKKDRFLASLNKKCQSFDRFGGKFGVEEKEKQLQTTKQALKQLNEKYKKVAGRVSEAQRSVQIYKSMNTQQQNTIAELTIKLQELQSQIHVKPVQTIKPKAKSPIHAEPRKSDNLELMSLRQRVRELTQAIQTQKKQHECAKASFQKKQAQYSKLLEKYFLQGQPI